MIHGETPDQENARRIKESNERPFLITAASILKQIIDDLPANRDWLDPNLEGNARVVITKLKQMGFRL